jgi:ribosomal protein L37AE/L43A
MEKLDLSFIYNNGRIKCGALSDEWYHSNNLKNLLNSIYEVTSFLNKYNVLLRERIYYIDNNIDTVQLCPYCNKNKLIFKSNKICLTQVCDDSNCRKILKSIRSKEMHQKMSVTVKEERSKKLSSCKETML